MLTAFVSGFFGGVGFFIASKIEEKTNIVSLTIQEVKLRYFSPRSAEPKNRSEPTVELKQPDLEVDPWTEEGEESLIG